MIYASVFRLTVIVIINDSGYGTFAKYKIVNILITTVIVAK